MPSDKPCSLLSSIGNGVANIVVLVGAFFLVGTLFNWLFGPTELGTVGTGVCVVLFVAAFFVLLYLLSPYTRR